MVSMASLSVLFGLFQEALSERWCSLSSWGQSLEACMFWRAELACAYAAIKNTPMPPTLEQYRLVKLSLLPNPHMCMFMWSNVYMHIGTHTCECITTEPWGSFSKLFIQATFIYYLSCWDWNSSIPAKTDYFSVVNSSKLGPGAAPSPLPPTCSLTARFLCEAWGSGPQTCTSPLYPLNNLSSLIFGCFSSVFLLIQDSSLVHCLRGWKFWSLG